MKIAILAIAILILFIGTVSAADNEINANLTSENTNMENIDDTVIDSNVNVLKANDDKNVIKSESTRELRDKDNSGESTINVNIDTTVYFEGNGPYGYYYFLQMAQSEDFSDKTNIVTYKEIGSSKWYDVGSYTFENEGTYYFRLYDANANSDVYSNVLTYIVGPSTTETETTISINQTTVAPNNPITITPTVYEKESETEVSEGSIEFFYITNDETLSMGTWTYGSNPFTYSFENEGNYEIYATYKENTKYSESNSTIKSILVNSNTNLSPVTITLTLNDTGFAPEENIGITVNVKNNNNEDVEGYVDLYDGEDNIIASNVAIGEIYTYQASTTPSKYQIYAVYNGSESYAPRNSSKVNYTVKNKVNINITIDGETNLNARTGSSYSGPFYKLYVTSDVSDLVVDVYDTYYDNPLLESDKSVNLEVASWYYESSETGQHEVYVKFNGNDEYLPCESNHITFNVLTSKQISNLILNPNYGVENKEVILTPVVQYYDYSTGYTNITGNLTLYNDSSYSEEIITIESDGVNNFTYTVRENTGSYASTSYSIYYTFEGIENNNYYYGSSSVSFNTLNENSLVISAKNSTEEDTHTDLVQIIEGGDVVFSVNSLTYYYSYGNVNISIYIEGQDEAIGKFPTSGYYGSSLENYTLNFDTSIYSNDEYKVYAIFEGYFSSSSYYAPATSNIITVQILKNLKNTSLSLTPSEITAKEGEEKIITPTVVSGDESVSVGDITYYDNGTEIEGYVNVSTATEFSTAALNIGIHNITAKYNGYDGYNPSEISNNVIVTIEKSTEVSISVTNPTYPENATVTIFGESGKTYTIKINGSEETYEITIPEGETHQSKELTQMNAGIYLISVVDEDKNTTLTINRGNPNLIITVNGNDTLIGESKNMTVTALGEGKFTINDESDEHELNEVIDLTNLDKNTTFTIHYSETTNYNSDEKSVFISVYTSYATEITIDLSSDSITKGENITITPTVTNQKGESVKKGQIEFYDENELIATIDLETNNTFTYYPTKSGSIYGKYLYNDELKLINSTSDVKTFTVSSPQYNTSITLNLSADEITSIGKIVIKAIVLGEDGKELNEGNVEIYDTQDYYYTSPKATLTAGQSINFTDDNYNPGSSVNLYAIFKGATIGDVIYNQSPLSAKYTYIRVMSNTLSLNANKTEIYAGESVDITATLTGGDGVITLTINNENKGTLTKNNAKTFTLTETGEYNFTATYTRGSDYYASCVSDQITVKVIEAPDIQLNIKLDNTSFSKNTNLTAEVNLTNKGEEISDAIVEFYNENNEKIGEINLTNTKEFKYNVGQTAGNHSIYAKYNDVNSTKKDYKVKDTLTITLTREGEGIVKLNDTVGFTITYTSNISENLELWINGEKAWNITTYDTQSIIFNEECDVGENNISIKFLGNDEFEACESNTVAVNVVKALSTSVTLELSSNEIFYGKNITITAKVIDENNEEVNEGNVSLYLDDSYGNNPKATITLGEAFSYSDDTTTPGTTHYLYAKYKGGTIGDKIYNPSSISAGVVYYKLYSNNLTLTVSKTEIYAGESVDITATLTGGVGTITLTINNEDNGTLTNGEVKTFTLTETGEYNFTANYTRGSDYYASCVSEQITVKVIEAPDIRLNIKLDNTSFSKNTTLTSTVNLTNKGEEISDAIVEFYNENDDKIGEINLTTTKEFKYNVGQTAGNYSIYAKYNDVNSTKEAYTVKDTLTITLTRDGEGVVKVNDTVNFNITYSVTISDNIELWINNVKIDGEDGTNKTSFKFSDDYAGENNISIKFLGNDEFEACESNTVTINVVKPLKITVTLTISTSEVFSGVNFTITPNVIDENGDNVSIGIVKIYNGYPYYQDPIVNVTASESAEYNDTTNNMGTQVFLYAIYMGAENGETVYAQSPVSASVNYTVMGNTQLNLSVNGNSEVNVKESTSLDILATLSGGNGNISLYIDGVFNTTLTADTIYSLTLPVGNYTLKAKYTQGSDYYVSCESNEVKVKVIENTTVNEIKVSVNDVTLPDSAVITVTATFDGIYEVDINGTLLNVTVTGGSGSDNITLREGEYYANITPIEGASITNTVFKVINTTSDKNDTITVVLNSDNLKITNGVANPSITLTLPSNATGTLKVTINGKTYTKTLTKGSATVTLTNLANGNYKAIVSYSGDNIYSDASTTAQIKVVKITQLATKITAKKQTFKVKKAKKYTITLKTKTGKSVSKVTVYLKVNGKTYKAKTTSKGKATFKVKITKKGKYTAKITFKGNKYYKASQKSVKFTAKK